MSRELCKECGGSQWVTWIDSDDNIQSSSCGRCMDGLEPVITYGRPRTTKTGEALIQACLAAIKSTEKRWNRRKNA